MMGYSSLVFWYSIMFQMRHYFYYSDADMLQWVPFERDIYMDFIIKSKNKD